MYLPQGYKNTTSLLSFFVVDDDGFLADADSVKFAITNPAGTQVHPQNDYIEAKTAGRFAKGCYYAISECSGEGWVVPADATIGQWTIEWKWRINASDAWQTFTLPFDVVASRDAVAGTGFSGFPYRTPISPLRVRSEGLTALQADDARVEELIEEAQTYIELACRQFFRPERQVIKLDGTHSERLFLNLPIVGVDEVRANRSTASASQASLAVNFARIDRQVPVTIKPDPRRNPSISYRASDSIYSGTYPAGATPVFVAGRLNQVVEGVFGFLEANGRVPKLIQRAALLLVYRTAVRFTVGSVAEPAGPMTSKTVDRHSVSFANTGAASVSRALARSKEVQEIIAAYRAPVGLGAAAPSMILGRLV